MANKLDLADAFLLGNALALRGFSTTQLIETIGMNKIEWIKWKVKYPTVRYFTDSEIEEIDNYFNLKKTK